MDTDFQEIVKLFGNPEKQGIEDYYEKPIFWIQYPFARFIFVHSSQKLVYFSINR